LGRKYGSPWIYAALEKGMEAFEGQPTVAELDDLYDWRTIDRHTRFVGVVGMGTPEEAATRALNAGFRAIEANTRCLPLALGKFDKLAQMLDVLKINALVVSPRLGSNLFEFAEQPEEAASTCRYTDLLLKKAEGGWHGYTSLWRSTLVALENALGRSGTEDRPLGRSGAEDRPLDRRNVLVVGHDGAARALAYGVRKRKGIVSITGRDDKQAKAAAEALGARHVPFGRLYDTLSDVVAVTDASLPLGHRKEEFNPGYFRPQMTVLDVTRLPEDTPALTEARLRSCRIVEPRAIFADLIAAQFKAITGKDLPAGAVEA
jgi:3-dehydroquinate dehydratase/shikimate dehydrogenase